MASVLRILATRCVFKAGQLTMFCRVLQEGNRAKIGKKGKMAEKFNGVFQISD